MLSTVAKSLVKRNPVDGPVARINSYLSPEVGQSTGYLVKEIGRTRF